MAFDTAPHGHDAMDFPSDRRQWKRVPAGFDVMFRIGEQSGVAAAFDISTGGIFVAVAAPPRIGERVYLTFILPGEQPSAAIKAIGEVVRTVAARPGQPGGFGVSIVALPMDSRRAIADYIEKASALTLDDATVDELAGGVIQVEPDAK